MQLWTLLLFPLTRRDFRTPSAKAMAGVPCSVTDVGESPLIVEDTGKVMPPKNPSALADAWRQLTTNRDGSAGEGLSREQRHGAESLSISMRGLSQRAMKNYMKRSPSLHHHNIALGLSSGRFTASNSIYSHSAPKQSKIEDRDTGLPHPSFSNANYC
jgi:hypothetical protein